MSPASRRVQTTGRSSSHVRSNRASWDREADEYQREHSTQLNRFDRMGWGIWGIPDAKLDVLGDVRGKDVLEYGCGGGQWSIALRRRGARPIGLDLSIRQLEHAKRLMGRANASFPLVNADAERVPLPDATFDIVFCDHGAMTFADPRLTVPEVSRVLRPGGLFAFNIASPILWLTIVDGDGAPATTRLRRDYFGMRRGEWDGTIEFQLPYGEWIRLFRSSGFEILDLIELRPPPHPRTTYPDFAPAEWSRRWPSENIWKLRKAA